jgi:putative ABC transport system substrate-binding protein
MRRREFITLLGGSVAGWPLTARAQQPATPVIGFLNGASPETYAPFLAAFRRGLSESGFVEGQNVTIEYRWVLNHSDRLPTLAAELIRHQVVLIVASGGDHVVRAIRAATATIPIVSTFGFDPVEHGLAASLSRPGGNVTGVSVFSTVLVAKRLELLRELLPNVSTVAFLVNPTNPSAASDTKEAEGAGRPLGLKVIVLNAATLPECEAAFADLARRGAGALTIQSDAFFNTVIEQLVSLAKDHAVPVIYARREYVEAGGLISYGSSLTVAYRQLGIYTGQVLKGTKPADLPIFLPTKFELVVNLATAKALGLEVPLPLLMRIDEVIE